MSIPQDMWRTLDKYDPNQVKNELGKWKAIAVDYELSEHASSSTEHKMAAIYHRKVADYLNSIEYPNKFFKAKAHIDAAISHEAAALDPDDFGSLLARSTSEAAHSNFSPRKRIDELS